MVLQVSVVNKCYFFDQNSNLITGESVRVISDTGQLPDGLTPNTVAFAVTTELVW